MSKRSLRNWMPVALVALVFIVLTTTLSLQTTASTAVADGIDAVPAATTPATRGGFSTGPDVTVRNLTDTTNWGSSGGVRAYSVGTDSCNVGTMPSNWCDDSPGCGALEPDQHPVIAQNVYRLSNGRFEQIGMSWLKHGFLSLNTPAASDCEGSDGAGNPVQCTQPPLGGDQLGVGCTDIYGSGLNGTGGPNPLGRRSEVDPTQGTFVFPVTGGGDGGTIGKRIQIAEADLTVAGAKYWVEGHYVVDDDARAGNGLNNASYREVTIDGSFDMSFPGNTVRETAAIFAWQAEDPMVEIVNVDTPSAPVQRFHAARRVTDLGGGQWHYEFAIHNMNSDRAARSFTVDFGTSTTITSVGFHDIEHHSGEAYDTDDWTPTVDMNAGTISWSTDEFALNEDANALRWGTMFSFWFDANQPPSPASYTLGLFKTGNPGQLDVPFAGSGPIDFVFSDGFESGDTTVWSTTVP